MTPQEQDQGWTEKSAPAAPNQLESSSTRDVTCARCGKVLVGNEWITGLCTNYCGTAAATSRDAVVAMLTLTRRDVVFLSLGGAVIAYTDGLSWGGALIVFGGSVLIGVGVLAACVWLDHVTGRAL